MTIRALVLSDNLDMARRFHEEWVRLDMARFATIDYACSPSSPLTINDGPLPFACQVWDVQADPAIGSRYDVIFSVHCRQLFPAQVVAATRCINFHPGFNPDNRGWFPQVFSIINGKRIGATIHEMDVELDHGAIIAQVEVPLYEWDTSLTAYERICGAEMELAGEWLPRLVAGNYTAQPPTDAGNLNLKKDFERLRRLDLNHVGTMEEHLRLLRALTHQPHANAYFIDEATSRKVTVAVDIQVVDPSGSGD